MDPLAEKYYFVSPYAYCNNNPVIFVEPDGKEWKAQMKDGVILYKLIIIICLFASNFCDAKANAEQKSEKYEYNVSYSTKYDEQTKQLLSLTVYRNDTIEYMMFKSNDGGFVIVDCFEDIIPLRLSPKAGYIPECPICDRKCRWRSFYSNGQLHEIVTFVYARGDFPLGDFSFEYGEARYYDEKGDLISIKVFD